MRLAVYSDFSYRRDGEAVWADEAFVVFCTRLADFVERLVLVGRLVPTPGRWHYRVPPNVGFAALPHYRDLSRPLAVARAAAGSVRAFWRSLEQVDGVWLLGPHPLAIAFAGLAAVRRRRVFLGVRQDFPRYVARRHPGRPAIAAAAHVMEVLWRALALVCPTVVVGPDLARRYRPARGLLEISVSLVSERDLVSAADTRPPAPDGSLQALSVGRLDAEKNPLMLVDVACRLDEGWRLVVCGDGVLAEALGARVAEAALEHRVELRGYVPLGDLRELYRASDAFLHVSWTEGLPQVLFEAFAAGLPVVATDVGGVRAAVGDAALLVPPGEPDAAAAALRRIETEPDLRARLVERGLERVRGRTSEAECRRLAAFLEGRSP